MQYRSFIITFLLLSQIGWAQTVENRFAGSINAVAHDFTGPVTGQLAQPQNFGYGVQVGTHVYLSEALNLSLQAGLSPNVKLPFGAAEGGSLVDVNMLMRFKFYNGRIMSEKSFLGPYVAVGAGMGGMANRWTPYLPVGAGMRFRLSDMMSINVESMFRQGFGQNLSSIQHGFGFTFTMPDKIKPVVFPEEEVKKPTPRERVLAYQAQKAKEAEEEAAYKKPTYQVDSDGDGIADEEDNCPDVMGLVQFGGCPYSEPNHTGDAASAAQVEKGIQEVAYVSRNQEPTPVAPEVAARVAAASEAKAPKHASVSKTPALANVFFDVNASDLTYEGKTALDDVVEFLHQNPQAKLQLVGHADATGSDRENKILSVMRAFAVKRYLTYEKGIALHRVLSNGEGENAPVADNASDEGRAQNRRVELQLL